MVEDPIGLKDLTWDKIFMALLRISLGLIWLWAFFDKLLGLGFSTAPENAWLAGGSPTQGYFMFAVNPNSPLSFLYTDVLGQFYFIMDIALMGMLLVVGLGLTFGLWTRLSSIFGIIFMLSIVGASWPFEHHPFLDEHIVYTLLLLLFMFMPVSKWIGLGNWWSEFITNLLGEKLGEWLT